MNDLEKKQTEWAATSQLADELFRRAQRPGVIVLDRDGYRFKLITRDVEWSVSVHEDVILIFRPGSVELSRGTKGLRITSDAKEIKRTDRDCLLHFDAVLSKIVGRA